MGGREVTRISSRSTSGARAATRPRASGAGGAERGFKKTRLTFTRLSSASARRWGGMYVGGGEGAVHPDSGVTLNGGLMDSLRQYLAEERLEGDNKYHCEFCDSEG